MLTNCLCFIIYTDAVFIEKANGLQLDTGVSKEGNLVASFVRLYAHSNRKAISIPVLNLDIAVAHTSMIEPNFFGKLEAIDVNLEANLITIVIASIKCVKIFLL